MVVIAVKGLKTKTPQRSEASKHIQESPIRSRSETSKISVSFSRFVIPLTRAKPAR